MSTPNRSNGSQLRRRGLVAFVTLMAVAIWGGVVVQFTHYVGSRPDDHAPAQSLPTSVSASATDHRPPLAEAIRDLFSPPEDARNPSPSVSTSSSVPRVSRPKPSNATSVSAPYKLIGIVGETALVSDRDGMVHDIQRGDSLGRYRVALIKKEVAVLLGEDRHDTLHVSQEVHINTKE